MAIAQVLRIICDRCGKTSIEEIEPVPEQSGTINPDAKAAQANPKTLAFLAMGGSIIPELLAQAPGVHETKMGATHATLDHVCADCKKRISDLVKQILYRTFKLPKDASTPTTAAVAGVTMDTKPDDNNGVPEDTGSSEAEAPRATRSRRSNPTTEEK